MFPPSRISHFEASAFSFTTVFTIGNYPIIFSYGVIIEFPDKNHPHLVLATATGATARMEFIYDVILLEYLPTGCYRCYSSQRAHL